MMRAAGALTARLPSVLLLLVLMLVMVTVTWCARTGNRRSEPVPMCHRVCDGPLVPCGGGDEKEQHDHTHYKPRRHLPVSRSSCRRVRGLTSGQRRFCRRHPELLRVLLSGYQLGASDCRHRFRHQRWNCAALGRHLDFGHVQVRGTREAAVMYALQSAAVTHALYAACRRGSVPGCACRQPGPDTRAVDFWKWSGCGEGLAHSGRQARRFLNARETEGDARSLMNRHNNRAGVKAVTGGRRRRCHCHGPSGSCSVRTCWLDAPSSFSVIGDRLQQQLEKSQLVQLVELAAGRWRLRPVDSSGSGSESGSSSSSSSSSSDSDSDSNSESSSRGRGGKIRSAKGRIERGRLVHLEPSPNYCEPDPAIGHNGTVGRVCRKNRDAAGSCEYLCCGRGYNTRVTSRRYCCNFHQRPGSPTVCRQRTRVRTCQ